MPHVADGAGPGLTGEEPMIRGKVTEVAFANPGFPVKRNTDTVDRPHWQLGDEISDDAYSREWRNRRGGGPYSRKPAVVKIPRAGGNLTVDCKVEITESKKVSGKGKLRGSLGRLAIEGELPSVSKGKYEVEAQIEDLPNEIGWYRGDLTWDLETTSPKLSVPLGDSFIELFAILGTPLMPAYAAGVWAEALRLVCEEAGCTGLSDPAEVAKKVVRYCFFNHGLKYDAVAGAPKYGCAGRGGTYQLENYIKRASQYANCYDQAGAVQSLTGAVGVELSWIFLYPFGHINDTNLLGWSPPRCNNPFFLGRGTPIWIDPMHSARSSFLNHAFCWLAADVYDACAEPHPGTPHEEYVRRAIDANPNCADYRAGRLRPGTALDFQFCPGVINVA